MREFIADKKLFINQALSVSNDDTNSCARKQHESWSLQ